MVSEEKVFGVTVMLLFLALLSGCSESPTAPCKGLQGDDLTACYANIAYSEKNPNICDEMPAKENISLCYEVYSINSNDYESCNLIKDDNTKLVACYGVIALNQANPKVCDKIPLKEEMFKCYALYAVRRDNIGICDLMDNRADAAQCEYSFTNA